MHLIDFVPVGLVGEPRASTNRQRPTSASQTSALRADIAARFGLPASASNEEIIAAFDTISARKSAQRASAVEQSAEDAVYDRCMGRGKPAPAPARAVLTDEQIFDTVFGR